MEDAHVARTDVRVRNRPNAKAKVFAVFDGHGGAEVARFCQMHLVDVLMEQDGWRGLYAESSSPALSGGESAEPFEEEDPLANSIGQALIHSFHALDQLIDDPSNRNEIDRWRLERPPVYIDEGGHVIVGESKSVAKDENASQDDGVEMNVEVVKSANNDVEVEMNKVTTNLQDLHLIGDLMSQEDYDSDESSGGELEIINKNDEKIGADVIQAELNEIESGVNKDDQTNGHCSEDEEGEKTTNVTNIDVKSTDSDTISSDSLNTDTQDGIVNDDSGDDSDSDEEEPRGIMSTDAYSLITRFLPFGNGSRSLPPNDNNDEEENPVVSQVTITGDDNKIDQEVLIPTQEQLMNPPCGIVAPSASIPTKIMNGRRVCNLPDHPIHAGCTSVVAVMLGKTLVVANAGDSRAVLCRAGGLTEPLSFDHKPFQVS